MKKYPKHKIHFETISWLLTSLSNPSLVQMNVGPRRFYSTRDITNLYPFIQDSLEWPFSELFSANGQLWNQYKYIAFNIFSCRILIILYKMLVTTCQWLHVVAFSEHDILHFWDNVHLFKYYSMKVPENCFSLFSCSNQTCIQVSKFSFSLYK